jgi:hypothetical protein
VIVSNINDFFEEVNNMASVGIFEGNCGQNSFATSEQGLQVNESVQLNGSTDLNNCMQANDNGCVYGITLAESPGHFNYVLMVDAQGPEGIGSGAMHLYFTDKTGDTYPLEIDSSTRSTHTVRYNSDNPAIIKIQWNNKSV